MFFSPLYVTGKPLPAILHYACSLAILLIAIAGHAGAQEPASNNDAERAIALFNNGQEHHEKGDLPRAVAAYKAALEVMPEFPEAAFQLGVAYRQSGDHDLAESSFRKAVEYRPDWSLGLAGLGGMLVDAGKFEEAAPLLKKAIELDAQNFPAFASLTELKLRTNASADELRELLRSVAGLTLGVRPPPSIWAARGSLERALGDNTAAKVSLLRTLEVSPSNRIALSELALISIDESDLTRAGSYIKKLEADRPDAPSTVLLKVRLLLAEGRNEEADKLLAGVKVPGEEVANLRARIAAVTSVDTAALEKQVADDPSNVTAAARLCSLYRVGDPARALIFCRRASELEPKNISHAVGYGAALVKAKSYPAAIELLAKLASLEPENATIHANLATAYFYSKRYAEAKREYAWLVEKQPNLVAAYYFLGITHDHLGEYLDAAANYQQFLKVADPELHKLEIERINLRLPTLDRQIRQKKGK